MLPITIPPLRLSLSASNGERARVRCSSLPFQNLSFFPERFPRVRQRAGIRRFIAGRYFKVFYRVHTDKMTVEVLRCWDGRREFDPHLS